MGMAGNSRRWVVMLSPIGVIGLGYGVQRLAGPTMGAWAALPTIGVFWSAIAGLIFWGRRGKLPTSWLRRPQGARAWSILAVAVGLLSVREFLSDWSVLKSPPLFLLWLAFGLINPWFEEGYWRGLLIDATSERLKGLGVVYSTLLFAVSHPLIWGVHSTALRHPAALLGLVLVGAVWGVTYWRTRSLRFTIVGHACACLFGLSVPVLLNLHVPSGLR